MELILKEWTKLAFSKYFICLSDWQIPIISVYASVSLLCVCVPASMCACVWRVTDAMGISVTKWQAYKPSLTWSAPAPGSHTLQTLVSPLPVFWHQQLETWARPCRTNQQACDIPLSHGPTLAKPQWGQSYSLTHLGLHWTHRTQCSYSQSVSQYLKVSLVGPVPIAFYSQMIH